MKSWKVSVVALVIFTIVMGGLFVGCGGGGAAVRDCHVRGHGVVGLGGVRARSPAPGGGVVVFAVGAALGGAAGYVLRQDRHRAIENLEHAFPDMPLSFRKAMANAMFRSLGRNAYEFLNLGGSSKERLTGLVVSIL